MKKKTFLLILLTTVLVSCKEDYFYFTPIDMYSADIVYNDEKAPKFLNVAAVSMSASKSDKVENMNKIKSMVEKIKFEQPDIQVIVFGELALSWYWDPIEKENYQKMIAEPIPGNSSNFIREIAIENKVNIVFGMTEVDTLSTKIYNSQVLIKASGELLKYRKRNLYFIDIDNNMNAGDEMLITKIDNIRVALFICSDMMSVKLTKEMADAKVDVILHSLSIIEDFNPKISYMGIQMNTWIVSANRFGTEGLFNYPGFTQIISPAGNIVKRSEGDNVYVYRKLGIFNK